MIKAFYLNKYQIFLINFSIFNLYIIAVTRQSNRFNLEKVNYDANTTNRIFNKKIIKHVLRLQKFPNVHDLANFNFFTNFYQKR